MQHFGIIIVTVVKLMAKFYLKMCTSSSVVPVVLFG